MAERKHRLKLADGVLYRERDGKHLFLQPAAPDWMVVNLNAAILLSRCDGAAMDEGMGRGEELLWEPAAMLFAEALGRGILVDMGEELAARGDDARAELRNVLQPLRVVHLKLTNRCNLHCSYCYAQSGRLSEELSEKELEGIASGVAEIAPVVEYVISGGEPLLHAGALEFAERVKRAGNVVHLLTNGTLIDESNAERIARVADLVKISVDGNSEATHGATRGAGNFARVMRAIGLLEDAGAKVVVAMTVTRQNQREIAGMVRRFGARLSLQPLFKAGRGSGMDDKALSGEEYYRALVGVEGVAPMGAVGEKLRSLRGRGVVRCAMAAREISIAETGDVYPCQMLHAAEFRAGNVREQTVREIYEESPVFQRLRGVCVDTIGGCSGCALRYLCGGACRARDYFEVGSVEKAGEFCAYEREALLAGLLDSVELVRI